MQVKFKLFVMKVLLLLQLTSAVSDENPLEGKIMGGTDTEIIDIPYQVSVRLVDRESKGIGRGHLCGGTALTNRLVVTSGLCILDKENKVFRWKEEFVLVMGATSLRSTKFPTNRYDVEKIVLHPDYTNQPATNDIALMITDSTIHTQYTPIGTLPINEKFVEPGTSCTISGWGRTEKDGPLSDRLQSATVQLFSTEDCKKHYKQFIASMLCAGSQHPNVKPLRGETGGPLQCEGRLVGIYSFHSGPETEDPTIYTDVKYYKNWIRKVNDTINYPSIGTLRAFPLIFLIVLAPFAIFM